MAVRKTESRIPDGLLAGDLGEAVISPDGKCALISYIKSPLALVRENQYVVMVTDPGLAASSDSYEWTFTQFGTDPVIYKTGYGQITFTPEFTGPIKIDLRILAADLSQSASLSMTQDVQPLNEKLEGMISDTADDAVPLVGNIETSRELLNDHNPYYLDIALSPTESSNDFRDYVFSYIYDGALQNDFSYRKNQLEVLADALNNGTTNISELAGEGFGVSAIRMTLLAMTNAALLPWTEVPEPDEQRGVAENKLRDALAAADPLKLIDLFNLVRFPKANIRMCAKIIEKLRNQYFPGVNFSDIVSGMSGTRSHWIARHYYEGPLQH